MCCVIRFYHLLNHILHEWVLGHAHANAVRCDTVEYSSMYMYIHIYIYIYIMYIAMFVVDIYLDPKLDSLLYI